MPIKMHSSSSGDAPATQSREAISRGLEEAISEAERDGYVSAEESKRRVKDLFARHKRRERASGT